MPQDVTLTVRDMLWNNWATSNPDQDTVKETLLPSLVHFTTREYATQPITGLRRVSRFMSGP